MNQSGPNVENKHHCKNLNETSIQGIGCIGDGVAEKPNRWQWHITGIGTSGTLMALNCSEDVVFLESRLNGSSWIYNGLKWQELQLLWEMPLESEKEDDKHPRSSIPPTFQSLSRASHWWNLAGSQLTEKPAEVSISFLLSMGGVQTEQWKSRNSQYNTGQNYSHLLNKMSSYCWVPLMTLFLA